MIFIGVDIGYYNMGLVRCKTDPLEVTWCNKVDITNYTHTRVSFCDCQLHHTHEMGDYVLHFIQEHRWLFDEADKIFIERQPPGGFGAIESLLFVTFREKVELINPNSLHKHLGIGHLDYVRRKEETIKKATPYLSHIHNYNKNFRKHDMADALCMCLYKLPKPKRGPVTPVQDFNVFRYKE